MESRGPSLAGVGRKAGDEVSVLGTVLRRGAVLSRGVVLYTDLNAVLCSAGIGG